MSSDSWAACAEHIQRLAAAAMPNGIVLCAPDLRGHGRTRAAQGPGRMALAALTRDLRGVIDAVFEQLLHVDEPAKAPFYAIGHSLGGALVASLVADAAVQPRIRGVCMVDIVEETAVFGLRHMPAFLEKRPPCFESVDAAARWYVAEGGMKSIEAAKRSVGRTLVPDPKDATALTWRTDLAATSGDWEGWFTGMNARFLSSSCPKLLLLANTDRLDKGLTLAMMQGKFQFEVVREAGHHVQEDQPQVVAEKLFRFVSRIDKLSRALPPVAAKRPDVPPPPPAGTHQH